MNVNELKSKNIRELVQIGGDLEVVGADDMGKDALVERILQRQVERGGQQFAAGVLDVVEDGFGFMRRRGLMPSPDDIYVSSSQVRRFGLRAGDRVSGVGRAPKEGEKYWGLLRVESVNGVDPETAKRRPHFDALTPIHPIELINLESDPKSLSQRLVNLVNPIGKGQRALIVSPPKAGKTMLLKSIANGITSNYPDILLMVALIGERPEEVTDMRRSVKGEVISSTFDEPTENHTRVAEMALEIAKRQVETGRDVVILLDSITRLSRAYNLALPSSGRTLTGGIDPIALYPPKRFFGAARKLEEAWIADHHRDLSRGHRLAHGRRHLRGVQGHRQLGAHPRPEACREAHLPGHRHPALRHPPGRAAARRGDAQDGLDHAPDARRGGYQRGHRAAAQPPRQDRDQRPVPGQPDATGGRILIDRPGTGLRRAAGQPARAPQMRACSLIAFR